MINRYAPSVPYYPKKMASFTVDPLTTMIVRKARNLLHEKEDDFVLMVVGTPGSGKSDLGMNIYNIYDPEGCSVDYIGLDKEDFSHAIQAAKNKEHPRFLMYDEANVTRGDHASKYYKDLMKLYQAIRKLEIFHVWNNPSAKKTPREFIEERIKAFIFIYEKVTHRPRKFYFFTKEQLLKLYDVAKGDLSHPKIMEYGPEIANHIGWFKKYEGDLRKAYDRKKDSRMDIVVEKFFDAHGKLDTMSADQVGKLLGYSGNAVRNWIAAMGDEFVDGKHYFIEHNGYVKITRDGVEKIKSYKKINMKRFNNFSIEKNKLKDKEEEVAADS